MQSNHEPTLNGVKIGQRVIMNPDHEQIFAVETRVTRNDGVRENHLLYFGLDCTDPLGDFFIINQISDKKVTIETRARRMSGYQPQSRFTLTEQVFFQKFMVVEDRDKIPLSNYSKINHRDDFIDVGAWLTPICKIRLFVAEPEPYRASCQLITGIVRVSSVSEKSFQIQFEVRSYHGRSETTTLTSREISRYNAHFFVSADPLAVVSERLQKAIAQQITAQIKLRKSTTELSSVHEKHQQALEAERLATNEVIKLQKQQVQAQRDKTEQEKRKTEALEKRLSQHEIEHAQTSVKRDPEETGDEEADGSARAGKRKKET